MHHQFTEEQKDPQGRLVSLGEKTGEQEDDVEGDEEGDEEEDEDVGIEE